MIAQLSSQAVVIIDDEEDICFLLGKVLKEKKYQVFVANNLGDGLRELEKISPAILFLDIRLPDGSGLDVLAEIRMKHPALKIIIMSAYDGSKERQQAAKLGADLFMAKPLSSELINQTLKNIQTLFTKL